ncbi:MAG: LacI family DNA-binding transcriptional regulator [Propionicimonas sp.]
MSDNWVVAESGTRASTLSDVAKLAGVSTMTVSRVINSHAKVAPATRDRVHAAMESLNYRANLLARGLASGRSRSIGVLTVDTMLYGPRAALRGIERAADAAGYSVTITTLENPTETAVEAAANLMRTRSCDGVVLVQPLIHGGSGGGSLAMPMVGMQAGSSDSFPNVSTDHRLGGRLATEHLLGLGHTTVWHLAGPGAWRESHERIAGWREALAAAGAPEPPMLAGDWSAASGYAMGLELLKHPEVTAAFVANDEMSLGVLHAMHEQGVGCPRPISLVGFDDTPDSPFYFPGLTTVRQDFDALGQRCVELLLQLIEGEAVPKGMVNLPPALVIRGSTASPG